MSFSALGGPVESNQFLYLDFFILIGKKARNSNHITKDYNRKCCIIHFSSAMSSNLPSKRKKSGAEYKKAKKAREGRRQKKWDFHAELPEAKRNCGP